MPDGGLARGGAGVHQADCPRMTRQYLTGGDRSVSHFCLPVSSGGLERQLQALALTAFVGQRLITFISKEHYSDLERLAEMIEAGQLTPSVGATYSLNEVPDAIRHLENGQARGKLAISI